MVGVRKAGARNRAVRKARARKKGVMKAAARKNWVKWKNKNVSKILVIGWYQIRQSPVQF
jgi:hypothetical protein